MSEPVQPICQVCLEPIQDNSPGMCNKCFEEAVDRILEFVEARIKGEKNDKLPE